MHYVNKDIDVLSIIHTGMKRESMQPGFIKWQKAL